MSPKAGDAFFLVVIMEVTFAGVRRDESRFYTDFAFYLHLQMLGDKNVAHGLGD